MISIDKFDNNGATIASDICMFPGASIIQSQIDGPILLQRGVTLGPNVSVGRYFGANVDSTIAGAQIGSFCTFGARVSVNPFNHPMQWLSIHEFQYDPGGYNWLPEYAELKRPVVEPFKQYPVIIGNDVWLGNNVVVLEGVTIGDGACIGANAVVTKDIPPYAVAAGIPARVLRYRFTEETIERLLAVKWWDMELSELSGLPFNDVISCLSYLENIKERKT
jgi:acetyltransferase-like isoleucine patch superfamily enzyme